MEKARIGAKDLAVGAALPWDVFTANGALLLRKGHVIANPAQLERLLQEGLYAHHDELEADRQRRCGGEVAPLPSVVEQLFAAESRLSIAEKTEDPKIALRALSEARELVKRACQQNRHIALAFVLLQQGRRYSLKHSVHSAILAGIVAQDMGFSSQENNAILAAALSMNVSAWQMQDRLQQQRTPLTDAQRDEINQHPEASYIWLKQHGVEDELWLDTVRQHHEQADGSGYPHQLKSAQVLPSAKLVQLADLYSARVSTRAYRSSVQASVALRDIFLERGKNIDLDLASHFIKNVGIYPPGTLVRLTNGEIAMVTQQTEHTNRPIVHSLIGSRGVPLPSPIRRDSAQQLYEVRDVVAHGQVNVIISMQQLWGKEAAGA